MTIVRHGRTEDVDGAGGEAGRARGARPTGDGGGRRRLGLTVEPLTPQMANRLEVPRDIDGVVVTDIDPDGRAAGAGLREGDVIRQVDGKPVRRRPSCDRRSAAGATVRR